MFHVCIRRVCDTYHWEIGLSVCVCETIDFVVFLYRLVHVDNNTAIASELGSVLVHELLRWDTLEEQQGRRVVQPASECISY